MIKNILIGVLAVAVAAMVYATLAGTERMVIVKISAEEIEDHISGSLPWEKEVLGLQFGVEKPKVSFEPGEGRVRVALSASAGVAAIQPEVGQLSISGRLHYLREKRQLYFIMPRVENLDIAAVGGHYEQIGELVFSALANEFLSRHAVHELPAATSAERLRSITVVADGLELAFDVAR
jgi:hypothetical protein